MERVNKIFNNILYKEYLNKLEAYEEKKYNTNVVQKIRSEYEQFIN